MEEGKEWVGTSGKARVKANNEGVRDDGSLVPTSGF